MLRVARFPVLAPYVHFLASDAEMDAEPVGVCAGTAHAVYFRLRPLHCLLPGRGMQFFDLAGGRVWLLPALHRRNCHHCRGIVEWFSELDWPNYKEHF